MRLLFCLFILSFSAYSQGIKYNKTQKPENLERKTFINNNIGLITSTNSGVSGIYLSIYPFTKGDFSFNKYNSQNRRIGFYTNIQNGILLKKTQFDYTKVGSEWADKVVIPFASNPRYNYQKNVKKRNIYNFGINYSFFNRETFSLISFIGCGIYATETFNHYSDKSLEPDWDYSIDTDYYFGDTPFVSDEKEIIFNQNYGLQLQLKILNFGFSYNTAPKSINVLIGVNI